MQFWRLWEFGFACVVLVLNAFCAIVYGRLYFRRRRAFGFALLAFTCAFLVFTDAFSVIVQIYGAFGFEVLSKPAFRFVHRVYMCVSTVLLIPAFIAPVYISRYILRETKA